MTYVSELILDPKTLRAHHSGHAHFRAQNTKNREIHATHDFLCSSDRYNSPEFRDILNFDIGQKMAELLSKNVCPYMGIWSNLGLLGPITW